MNNRRFTPLLCVLAGVAIVAFLSGVLFAHHKGEYRGMDDRLQKRNVHGPENHINANWAITPTVGSAVTWFADDPKTPNPTITPIAPLVRTSIAKWMSAVPQLKYAEGDEGNANIIISYRDCGVAGGLGGYFEPMPLTPVSNGALRPAWHRDSTRNANPAS